MLIIYRNQYFQNINCQLLPKYSHNVRRGAKISVISYKGMPMKLAFF